MTTEGYAVLSDPIASFTETCFENELVAERGGTVPVAVVNRALGLGVYQVFRIEQEFGRNQLASRERSLGYPGLSVRSRFGEDVHDFVSQHTSQGAPQ